MKKEEARDILGVSSDQSSVEEIRKAYKKKALATHPDKNPNDPDAKSKFQKVSEAYKCLTDPNYVAEEGLGDVSEEELFNMFNEMFYDMFDSMAEEFGQMADGTDIPPPPPEFIKAFLKHEMSNEMNGTSNEFDFNDVMKDMDPSVLEDIGGFGSAGLGGSKGEGSRKSARSMFDADEANDMMRMMMASGMASMGKGGEDDLSEEEMAMMAQMMGGGGGGQGGDLKSMMSLMGGMGLGGEDDFDDGEMAMMAQMMGSMGMGAMPGGMPGGNGRSRGSKAPSKRSSSGSAAAKKGSGSLSKEGEGRRGKDQEAPTTSRNVDAGADLEVGVTCLVRGSQVGTVRYIGEVHYAKGDWVGVELEDGGGKNNGTIKGKSYFSCEPGFGIMVRPSDVEVM